MQRTPEHIVPDVVRSLLHPPSPAATLSLDRQVVRLARPAVSHADWQGPNENVLAQLFLHLPVPDLLRLGYLFTPRWREVWRMSSLFLHDRQFASLDIPRSEVANAITNVLEEYVDGEGVAAGLRLVKSFRVESTEWTPDHAARWCAALQRGRAVEVVLFNRGFGGLPAMLIRLPPSLLECTSVQTLHLGFFTVDAGELDALTETMDLGLHGCACRDGVVEGVVAACSYLQRLSVQDGSMQSVVVRAAPSLWRLSMLRTVSRSLTVYDVPELLELLPGYTAALSIRRSGPRDAGAPGLELLMRLHLPRTTLEIDGAEIAVDRQAMEPQIQSVGTLWLALDYTALGGMEEHMVPRMVQQMLMRFPRVTSLTIERKDAVSPEEGLASQDKDHRHGNLNIYDGFDGVTQSLQTLTLFNFRAGNAELALTKALMDKTEALRTVHLQFSARRHGREMVAAMVHYLYALYQFTNSSPNQSLWDHTVKLQISQIREPNPDLS